ncbi:MAG: DUF177 domain-containing protein [bacterium]|nr:DUF177 domain-containing protein [bacterium]
MESLIDVSRIRVGETINVVFKDLELNIDNLEFTRPIEVSVRLTNTGKCITVKGVISTSVNLTCNRCLEVFEYQIRYEIDVEYYKKKERYITDLELDSEMLNIAYYEDDRIDLMDEVRQCIILALPMKSICKEGCLGLCPHCGRNLNKEGCDCKEKEIDERLAKLGKLLK